MCFDTIFQSELGNRLKCCLQVKFHFLVGKIFEVNVAVGIFSGNK